MNHSFKSYSNIKMIIQNNKTSLMEPLKLRTSVDENKCITEIQKNLNIKHND